MAAISDTEMLWHNDGHIIHLRLNKSEVEIIGIDCPHGKGAECWNERYGCLVKHFVGVYGLECNVGVCPVQDRLQICWSIVGDAYDVEAGQLWFVPLNDEAFSGWLSTRNI